MGDRVLLAVDVAVKALLVGMLAFIARSGREQFDDDAYRWRVLFALAIVIVPVGWWLAGKPRPYPFAIDILVVAPFLIDVLGNTLELQETIDWWDANHLLNWMLITLAIGLFLVRVGQAPWPTLAMVTGLGAALAIIWEAAEYAAFIRGSTEEATGYTNALRDELFGLAGSFLAGVIAALLARRRNAGGEPRP